MSSNCSLCGKNINTEKDKYVVIEEKDYCFQCGFNIYKKWEITNESDNKRLE